MPGYDEEFILFAGNGITVALEVGVSSMYSRITASTCAFNSIESEAFADSKLAPEATSESASHDPFQPSSSVQKLHSNATGATTLKRTAWVGIYAPPKKQIITQNRCRERNGKVQGYRFSGGLLQLAAAPNGSMSADNVSASTGRIAPNRPRSPALPDILSASTPIPSSRKPMPSASAPRPNRAVTDDRNIHPNAKLITAISKKPSSK
jgi:hypothetical protein